MKIILKTLTIILLFTGIVFVIYIYKLHALAVEGNKIFDYRCTTVNPHLIRYKKSFLQISDYINDPEGHTDTDIGAVFADYNSGLRAYVEEENKWLTMQNDYINRWDFQLIEPWYMKQAAQYQWKMYEGYRDDAKYMIATYDAGGATDEIDTKFTEARDRRNKFSKLYYDFFDQASAIRDWRKIFGNVPLPEGCNKENMTIPETSGSIDWDIKSPVSSPGSIPVNSEFKS